MENILLIILLILVVGVLFGMVFIVIWSMTIGCYCKYKLLNRQNKIEWQCDETWDSIQKFRNKESNMHICYLRFRILPSELNTFVRIFGDNEWIKVFDNLSFENKEDFIKFVSDFKTRGDIRSYINKRNGELWRHP